MKPLDSDLAFEPDKRGTYLVLVLIGAVIGFVIGIVTA